MSSSSSQPEIYTNGYNPPELAFMRRRTLATHGFFIEPFLRPGLRLLDLGCGPGSMTLELAARVGSEGAVVGVDRHEPQFAGARQAAEAAGLPVTFRAMDAYRLEFPDASLDGVFSHALFEHLARPMDALAEVHRVLKPGGFVGLRSPDWGGLVLHPLSDPIRAALAARNALQTRNGGTIHAGRHLAGWLREAGFTGIEVSARYEIYSDNAMIGRHLAQQMDRDGQSAHADAWRAWSAIPSAMFAQAWFAATARK